MRVRCHASAPDSARASAIDGKCNNVLGDVIGPLTYVGLSARRPDTPDGRVWLQCPRKDCRTWNVFEVATPAGVTKRDG